MDIPDKMHGISPALPHEEAASGISVQEKTDSLSRSHSLDKHIGVPSIFQEMGLKERTVQMQGPLQKLARSSANNYYPLLRFLGYFFAATFSPFSIALSKYARNTWEDSNGTAQPFASFAALSFSRLFGKQPRLNIQPVMSKTEWAEDVINKHQNVKEGSFAKFIHPFRRTDLWDKKHFEKTREISDSDTIEYNRYNSNVFLKPAKLLVSKIEALIFAGLTTFALWRDLKGLKANVAEAVAAERGKKIDDVGVVDLLRSNNPFVVQAINRVKLQAVVRYTADASFLWGLKPGLIAEAVRTTIERSMFISDKIPYDFLLNAIKEVQEDNLTLAPQERLINAFVNGIQRTRKDFGRAAMNREQIAHMHPVFEKMADATLEKRLGINEAVYLLGMGMDELNPAQSMINVNAVIENGLAGVVNAKKGNSSFVINVSKQAPTQEDEGGAKEKNPKAVDSILAQGPRKNSVKPPVVHNMPQQTMGGPESAGFGRF